LIAGLLLAAACGREQAPSPQSPGSPAITDLQIVPPKPYAASILTAQARATDPQGRGVAIQYQWLRNGAEIPGATTQTLRPPDFARGNEIRVQATPVAAGGARGPSMTSSPVSILNSAPYVASLTVTPGMARRDDTLSVDVEGKDPDGDPLVYTYRWFRNGVEIPGATGPTLPARTLQKGDTITVRVVAADQELASPPSDSSPVLIVNAPPRVVGPARGQSRPNGEFVYQVAAEDLDGDRMTYTLSAEAPKGMTIQPTTGTMVWRPTAADIGTYRFTVTISDGDGGVLRQEVIVTVTESP
jgi:hypothetical protein